MNVLLIEDHDRTREAVVAYLNGVADMRARGANSLRSAMAQLRPDASDVDIALVDLGLGAESGLDAIDWLSARDVPCVVFTVSDDANDVTEALARGAVGYLLKDDAPDAIARALRDVLAGRHPISSGVTRHLLPRTPSTQAWVKHVGLTPREQEVLIALARGLTYAEAAEAVGCAVGTVQSHVKHVYEKLDVNSKTEACAWAWSVGLVD